MRAIQAWRWMEGRSHVQQSYIVRVPEDELDYHLPRIAAQQQPGLPPPNIVDVDPLPSVNSLTDRITAVLREELGLEDFDGDQLYEGAIDPRELAEQIAAELNLREERIHADDPLYEPNQRRWVSPWTAVEDNR